jgi:hypothetical protein
MKTTVDLPEEVLRKAKIAAVERKTTLKELICQSLLREIDSPLSAADPKDTGGSSVKNARLLDTIDRLAQANELAAAFSRGNNADAPVGRLRRDEIYDRKGLY